MPDEIRSISGGAGGLNLNFKVEWYVSEDYLPETAEENTIAVISDQDVANWIFSVEEPSAAAEGDVWFCASGSSSRPFNALTPEEENDLFVYINAAKQLVQSEWQTVLIKIYQNGEWHPFETILYQDGVFNTALLGNVAVTTSCLVQSNGSLLLYRNWEINHDKYFDITPYSTIQFDVIQYNYGRPDFNIIDESGTIVAFTGQISSATTGSVIKLNVADVNTKVKFYLKIWGNQGDDCIYINNIKLV